MAHSHCGLFANNNPIPLQGVRVEATLSGLTAEVTVTHRYTNSEDTDLEAVYVFPLEEGAAVSGFKARVGDRVIEGRVEEREKAFEQYDDAMADGHGAFLLDQERPNVFTASVGNLKPGVEVLVSVSYVATLNFEGEAVRWMLPTTISPRYVPAGPPEVGQPDGDRVNPPTIAAVPYGLSLEVRVATDKLKRVESPSHTVSTEFDDDGACVTLTSAETALDRDFVLMVTTRDARAPSAIVAQEADGTRVACVTFYPDEGVFADTQRELHYVIDCSGSMQGDSIEQARRAMMLCVRAMSEGDTFNIYRFGSHFTSLWSEARGYSQATLDEATAYIEATSANMGGTEILRPMQDILQRKQEGGRSKQVLLLTDGEVSNEDQVIALCQTHASSARVFAFGIGAGVSEHLVRGVARASKGAAEFIYPGERIEPKVLRMFARVNSRSFEKVRIDWGHLEVEQAPAEVPPLFAGESVTVWARVRGGRAEAVTLRADDRTYTVPIDLERPRGSAAIPKLWARTRIRDLEEGKGARKGSNQSRRGDRPDRTRERVIELGKRYGLMSSATSYVCIETREEGERSTGQATLRQVPVALTAGWGGHGSVMPQGQSKGGSKVLGRRRAAPKKKMSKPMPIQSESMAPPPMAPSRPMAPPPSPVSFGGPGGPPPAHRGASSPSLFERAKSAVGDLLGSSSGGGASRGESRAATPSNAAPSPEPVSARANRSDGYSRAQALEMMPKEESMVDDDSFEGEGADDNLFELLMAQRADGSFLLTALSGWVTSAAMAKLREAARTVGEGVVATAAVLRVLETKAPGRKLEWAPAASKARRFLDKQSGAFDASAVI